MNQAATSEVSENRTRKTCRKRSSALISDLEEIIEPESKNDRRALNLERYILLLHPAGDLIGTFAKKSAASLSGPLKDLVSAGLAFF